MTIDERLENISQQLEILTGMQHANERRFAEITVNFVKVHESIQSLENIARIHEARLDGLEENGH
ncbi:MAG TPA: hypothetical protein VH110_05275 [Candidatus Acidoferrum sp.]|jgi:hypothetical protein|nr:hypothetical protein [Candidatus Acidoferrum sp.]